MVSITASYWAWFGLIAVIAMLWSDLKRMTVDQRRNYFMMGATLALLSHYSRPLWFILGLLGFSLLVGWLIPKLKLGRGDAQSMTWMVYGFGIQNFYSLIWFFAVFAASTTIVFLFKQYVMRVTKPTPFFPVLAVSYLIPALLYGFF